MEINQSAAFLKDIFLEDYGKDPAEPLQPKSLVNGYISTTFWVTSGSPVIVSTAHHFGTQYDPPKLTSISHNQDLSRKRFFITKLVNHQQFRVFAYHYDMECMLCILKTLGEMICMLVFV